jgi:hypothetical protein
MKVIIRDFNKVNDDRFKQKAMMNDSSESNIKSVKTFFNSSIPVSKRVQGMINDSTR